jgi:hypothetical protein
MQRDSRERLNIQRAYAHAGEGTRSIRIETPVTVLYQNQGVPTSMINDDDRSTSHSTKQQWAKV